MGSSSRRLLYQSTHSSVAYSTASSERHGPFRQITTVSVAPEVFLPLMLHVPLPFRRAQLLDVRHGFKRLRVGIILLQHDAKTLFQNGVSQLAPTGDIFGHTRKIEKQLPEHPSGQVLECVCLSLLEKRRYNAGYHGRIGVQVA